MADSQRPAMRQKGEKRISDLVREEPERIEPEEFFKDAKVVGPTGPGSGR